MGIDKLVDSAQAHSHIYVNYSYIEALCIHLLAGYYFQEVRRKLQVLTNRDVRYT